MTAGLRLTLTVLPAALALAWGTSPLAAQNTTQPAPVSNDVIGPSELRDFSLGKPANRDRLIIPPATAPATTAAPPVASAPSRQQPSTSAPVNRAAPTSPPDTAQSEPRSRQEPATATQAEPSSSVTVALPSTDTATAPSAVSEEGAGLGSQPGLVPVTPPESASIPLNSGPAMWPWLLAALLAGGGALFYAKRQRLRRAMAGDAMALDARQPAPGPIQRTAAPIPPRPVAAPSADPAAATKSSGMVVSSRLRPRLDIQFIPERLIIEEQQTTLRFAVMLLNSGNAPALDVLLEAAMFNAGPSQDDEIGAFFAHPLGRGTRIPELLPLQNLTLRSEVVLPTSALRLFEVGGRRLFVPLVAFNALYRWSGKDAQTSESFVVGIDTNSEKMAPFRMEGGARQFRTIAARPHSVRLRK